MRIATTFSTARDPEEAARSASEGLVRALGRAPDWALLQVAVGHAPDPVRAAVERSLGGASLHGSSSCLGVMTREGMHSEDGVGLGLLGICDEEGSYGTGCADIGADPAGAAREAVTRAIDSAGRPGETPAMLWLTAAPGHEEAVLTGIASVVGPGVPIVGGSAADNTVEGHWYLIACGAVHRNAVVVSALYPSTRIASAFQSGYEPTKHRGRATKARGRLLMEIDGSPAADVYNAWTGGAIQDALVSGGNILAKTTLFPIGRRVGQTSSTPSYRLAHPDAVTADRGLSLFADVNEGDELVLMAGSTAGLVARAERVAMEVDDDRGKTGSVAGALVVFCAGCMLAVREHMPAVAAGLDRALAGAPFLGCFTFGEQGCFAGGENHHANLMISVTTFARS